MRVTIELGRYRAALFDLDGIITDTASVHAAAWAQMLDDYLRERAARTGLDAPGPGEDHRPFTHEDYLEHVDGKLVQDGVEHFLTSRGITLPMGERSDPPEVESIFGLGHRKDGYFLRRLREDGVVVFDSTVLLARRLRDAGVGVAVFSASRNCRAVLEAAGVADLFAVRVDGLVAAELGLPGKPDPAVLLEAARRLEAAPGESLVVEDSQAGVEAGRRGGFALVIGVDRHGEGEALLAKGADVVVADLVEVELSDEPPNGDGR